MYQYVLERERWDRGTKSKKSLLGHSPYSLSAFGRKSLDHDGCVNTAAWNAQGNLILTGSDDTMVKVWDANVAEVCNSKNELALRETIATGHSQNILCAEFNPVDENVILSCGVDGQLRMNCNGSSYLVGRTARHFMMTNFAFAPQSWHGFSNLILTAGEGPVEVFDLRHSSNTASNASWGASSMVVVPFSKSGLPYYIVGGQGSTARVYDMRKHARCDPSSTSSISESMIRTAVCAFDVKAPFTRFTENIFFKFGERQCERFLSTLSISGITISSDEKEMLASMQNGFIHLFPVDLTTSTIQGPSKTYGGHRNRDTFLKNVKFYGENEEYILSGSDCGNLHFWDRETTELVALLKADNEIVNGSSPNPFNSTLVVYGIDSDAKVFSMQDTESVGVPAKAIGDSMETTYSNFVLGLHENSMLRGPSFPAEWVCTQTPWKTRWYSMMSKRNERSFFMPRINYECSKAHEERLFNKLRVHLDHSVATARFRWDHTSKDKKRRKLSKKTWGSYFDQSRYPEDPRHMGWYLQDCMEDARYPHHTWMRGFVGVEVARRKEMLQQGRREAYKTNLEFFFALCKDCEFNTVQDVELPTLVLLKALRYFFHEESNISLGSANELKSLHNALISLSSILKGFQSCKRLVSYLVSRAQKLSEKAFNTETGNEESTTATLECEDNKPTMSPLANENSITMDNC
mmetsp:Transcript_24943/g.40444  ORF Transcript_24943/g.40444 Transcript_24943/m.40444 type:complete len:692 (-) Transcript_24943:1667-3742(-)